MGISIEYKGWKFDFDKFPSPQELEARYNERVEELQARSKPQNEPHTESAGDVPLSPMQQWFFAQEFEQPSYWNHGIVYTPSLALEPDIWERAWSAVIDRHDALRTRFRHEQTGWTQTQLLSDEIAFDFATGLHDLDDVVLRAHATLDIENGPLACMFAVGETTVERLVIAVHHLVIGGFSWPILAGDLLNAASAFAGGAEPTFAAKGTSMRNWVEGLAANPVQDDHLTYWLDSKFDTAALGPAQNDAPCFEATSVHCRTSVRGDFADADVDALRLAVLTALARVLWDWCANDRVIIAMEANGRNENIVPKAVLNRTIGWLNTMYPVVLERPQNARGALEDVQQSLSAVPRQSLRYMQAVYSDDNAERKARLLKIGKSSVLFNFMGRATTADMLSSLEYLSLTRGPANHRAFSHEVFAYFDADALYFDWIFSPERHDNAAIRRAVDQLAAEFQTLIDESRP